MKKKITLILFENLMIVFLAFPSLAFCDVSVIVHPSKKDDWTEKKIKDLYLGVFQMRQTDIFDQVEGQAPRAEFYEKFLNRSESQIKRQRSILVFSGDRVPTSLADDAAVFEQVKTHPNAIGYVSSEFYGKASAKGDKDIPVVIVKIK